MKVALIGSKIDEQNSKRIKSIISSLEKLGHKVDKSMFERTLEEELKNIDTTYKKKFSINKICGCCNR